MYVHIDLHLIASKKSYFHFIIAFEGSLKVQEEAARVLLLRHRRYSLVSEADTVVELFVNGVRCERSKD